MSNKKKVVVFSRSDKAQKPLSESIDHIAYTVIGLNVNFYKV